MIVFYYTDLDNLETILASANGANSQVTLTAKHRCYLADDQKMIFGRYLLPGCIEEIENELGIDSQLALTPLVKGPEYMKYILSSTDVFDDRRTGLETFVLTFSEDQDNKEIWMREGSAGRGVAIGFDTDKLAPDYMNLFNVFSGRCSYWSDEVMDPQFRLNPDSELYSSVRDCYKLMSKPEVISSFKEIYRQSLPDASFNQRMADTLVSNLITRFSPFNKYDTMRCEREYRISVSIAPNQIRYIKDAEGDYIPVADLVLPADSLRMMVLGSRSPRNSYGMIRSLLTRKGFRQDIPILQSAVRF